MSTTIRPAAVPRRRRRISRWATPFAFLAPVLLLFLSFKAYPVLYALYLSFTTNEAGQQLFVGFDNYIRLASDPLFRIALGNTVLILVVQVPIMLVTAVFLAVAFNSRLLRGRTVFRVAYFIPIVMGLVAYGILFSALLKYDDGLVNFALSSIGLPKVPWLADPFWAKMAIVLALSWHYVGNNAVIYLAQLQAIPTELYEAAAVDGASRWQQFRNVTLPGLRPALVLTIVLSTIGTLQLFDEPYVLTNGGPNNATLTIGMYLYQNAFQYFDFGYASAIGYALTLIVALVSVIQMLILRRRAS
ncbi:carbohydrate ABC transporter permease [Homoserinibacter sp. GY 40078]|uniref:carbohydrate ABC transporter permease n=1 Tax=Homoserinibacter sp. GY 40078 TaxID=2603275 RepID=UPI0011C9533A|nr:sugar ABC transporter permease [Homoserinibacter sp. GY 40078]TXK18558.1 sugar ABC transporter permease [Homoserinibacter sp. GY 40078]